LHRHVLTVNVKRYTVTLLLKGASPSLNFLYGQTAWKQTIYSIPFVQPPKEEKTPRKRRRRVLRNATFGAVLALATFVPASASLYLVSSTTFDTNQKRSKYRQQTCRNITCRRKTRRRQAWSSRCALKVNESF